MTRSATILIGWALIGVVMCGSGLGADAPPCTCEVARNKDGWCERHQVGYVGGILIRSKPVFETLDAHGHVVDLSTFRCEECRKAIQTDGYCESDSVGFVNKLAYFSRLNYELARGERTPRASITCRTCLKNAES